MASDASDKGDKPVAVPEDEEALPQRPPRERKRQRVNEQASSNAGADTVKPLTADAVTGDGPDGEATPEEQSLAAQADVPAGAHYECAGVVEWIRRYVQSICIVEKGLNYRHVANPSLSRHGSHGRHPAARLCVVFVVAWCCGVKDRLTAVSVHDATRVAPHSLLSRGQDNGGSSRERGPGHV